jgi:hypothetical protein
MAGLLDFYQFDPNSYQRNGLPGWLGAAFGTPISLSGTGFQQPIQPSPQPSGMGAAAGYGAGVDLPPNAAPVSGTLPPSAVNDIARAQAVQAAPQGPGVLDRLTAGATNFTTGGNPIAGFLNMISGLTTGTRTDPAGMLAQTQLATYNALRGAGLPAAVAKAAALNPDVMKTIAPQLYSKPTLVETGTDPLTGQKSYAWVQPDQMRTTPAINQGAPIGAQGTAPTGTASGSFQQIADAIRSGATGEQLLEQLPKGFADQVKGINEGRIPYPSGFVMKTPFGQILTQAVAQYEPGVDATQYGARSTMRKDLAKTSPGSAGGQITFAGTSINHLADVAKSAEALDNSNGLGIAPLGHLINNIRSLGTTQAGKVSKLEGDLQHYGQEVTKFYAGSPGGEGERARFLNSMGAAKTKEEIINALQAERDLIPGRISELRNRIQSTMGASADQYTKQLDQAERALPEIDAILRRMRGGFAPTMQVSPAQQQLPRIATPADAAKLPRGTHFLDPNGIERIVP